MDNQISIIYFWEVGLFKMPVFSPAYGISNLIKNESLWHLCTLESRSILTIHDWIPIQKLKIALKNETKILKIAQCALTSFVFHLWRCIGKWSDLGNDSRLSGNFSGSPSVIKVKNHQIRSNPSTRRYFCQQKIFAT